MTQLTIAGVEAVLPQDFSCTVKRENPFFTKSGEYTYDVTLRLDNPVNNSLYGFIHRLNRTEQIETGRKAVLTADGRVYCRGSEIVTRWTHDTVSIQIVGGESELNFLIGQDKRVESLALGSISDADSQVVYPLIRTGDKAFVNCKAEKVWLLTGFVYRWEHSWEAQAPCPYLCVLVDKIIAALGYTVGRNQLKDTLFKRLFIVNTRRTNEFARMVPGWTVKDLISEVERLCGVVFVTDNVGMTCDILLKTTYYLEARQLPLRDVIDDFEAEVEDEDGREEEFTACNVGYNLPDGYWSKLMRLPEFLNATTVDYPSFALLKQVADHAEPGPFILRDASTGRRYIKTRRTVTYRRWGDTADSTFDFILEVDQFADLKRDDTDSTLELKLTPAPMSPSWVDTAGLEFIDLGSSDGFGDLNGETSDGSTDGDEGEDGSSDDTPLEDAIRSAAKEESSAGDLYCAFCDGRTYNSFPQPYTDGYHAQMLAQLYGYHKGSYGLATHEGSLRLGDLDEGYYQGAYQIDTRHAVTFETFDPNMIDTRQVYVIRNRRYVVRDVEETVAAEGRQKRWKVTCYRITVSDEAIEKRWVLTKGVWDDGAAWLDDGRWNDEPD